MIREVISIKLSSKEKKFIKRASKERKEKLSTFIRGSAINKAQVVLQEDFK